jgi:hypothetical protein
VLRRRRPNGAGKKDGPTLHAWSLLLSQSRQGGACCRNRKTSMTSLAFARFDDDALLGHAVHTPVFLQEDLPHETTALCLCPPLLLFELTAGFGTHEQLWRQMIQPLLCEQEKVDPISLQCPLKKSGTIIVARSVGSISLTINL